MYIAEACVIFFGLAWFMTQCARESNMVYRKRKMNSASTALNDWRVC